MSARQHLVLLAPAIAFAIGTSVQGQILPETRPEAVGMSSLRLARVDSLLRREIEAAAISGAVTAVARNGHLVHFSAHGSINDGASGAMRPDMIFRLASMTKPVTAVAALILYEEGRFLLNDPVENYLPEFSSLRVLTSDTGVAGTRPTDTTLRVRHLFNHTSGFTYGVFGQEPIAAMYRRAGLSEGLTRYTGSTADFVGQLALQPLLFDPGTQWQYGLSNDVLGRLVEVVSGQSLEAFMRERIFEPLEMHDTYFYVPTDKLPRVVDFFVLDDTDRSGNEQVTIGNAHYTPAKYLYEHPSDFFSGGAGLASTARDYLRFLQMLLNGGELGGIRIISPATVGLLSENSIGELSIFFPNLFGDRYGLGVGIRTDRRASGELESNGTYMWAGASHHHFWVDPREGLIGVIFTQRIPEGGGAPLIPYRVLVYQAIMRADQNER